MKRKDMQGFALQRTQGLCLHVCVCECVCVCVHGTCELCPNLITVPLVNLLQLR